jgi:hypothetical protein
MGKRAVLRSEAIARVTHSSRFTGSRHACASTNIFIALISGRYSQNSYAYSRRNWAADVEQKVIASACFRGDNEKTMNAGLLCG